MWRLRTCPVVAFGFLLLLFLPFITANRDNILSSGEEGCHNLPRRSSDLDSLGVEDGQANDGSSRRLLQWWSGKEDGHKKDEYKKLDAKNDRGEDADALASLSGSSNGVESEGVEEGESVLQVGEEELEEGGGERKKTKKQGLGSGGNFVKLPMTHVFSKGSKMTGEGKYDGWNWERAQEDPVGYRRMLKARDVHRIQWTVSQGADSMAFVSPGSVFPDGLYYVVIQIGSPPQDFTVQVDTGSDLLWIPCDPCNPCNPPDPPFDSKASSTVSNISCSDMLCEQAQVNTGTGCMYNDEGDNSCHYTYSYADQAGTTGILRQDIFTTRATDGSTVKELIPFGCVHSMTGNLLNTGNSDGVLGLANGPLSLTTNLALKSKGAILDMFAVCLSGEGENGATGNLYIGGVDTPPEMLWTSYTEQPSIDPFYYLDLEDIHVAGVPLGVAKSSWQAGGVILDTGSTVTVLTQPLYNAFFAALNRSVVDMPYQDLDLGGGGFYSCYSGAGNSRETLNARFPQFGFVFSDGSTLNFKPEHYLILYEPDVACAYIDSTVENDITVIGAVTLRNMLIVHDRQNKKIGWIPMDCVSESYDPSDLAPMVVTPVAAPAPPPNATTPVLPPTAPPLMPPTPPPTNPTPAPAPLAPPPLAPTPTIPPTLPPTTPPVLPPGPAPVPPPLLPPAPAPVGPPPAPAPNPTPAPTPATVIPPAPGPSVSPTLGPSTPPVPAEAPVLPPAPGPSKNGTLPPPPSNSTIFVNGVPPRKRAPPRRQPPPSAPLAPAGSPADVDNAPPDTSSPPSPTTTPSAGSRRWSGWSGKRFLFGWAKGDWLLCLLLAILSSLLFA